jgi:hypothetical protein
MAKRIRVDTQLVELAGRNWLASELLRAGVEVAKPERDRGIDLIAYIDRDRRVGNFVACPIQMKAATGAIFSLYPKYAKFPGLLLVYVWNLADPQATKCFALTYVEALRVARRMGWTRTGSWLKGGRFGRRGYSTTRPSKKLRGLLVAYEITSEKWWRRISKVT